MPAQFVWNQSGAPVEITVPAKNSGLEYAGRYLESTGVRQVRIIPGHCSG